MARNQEPRKIHREYSSASNKSPHKTSSTNNKSFISNVVGWIVPIMLGFIIASIFDSSLRIFLVNSIKDTFNAITWPLENLSSKDENSSSFDDDLTGLSETDAIAKTWVAGWDAELKETYDGYRKAGTVSYQVVDESNKVVYLYISKGFPDEHIIFENISITPNTHELALSVGESVDLILNLDIDGIENVEDFMESSYIFSEPAHYAQISCEAGGWLEGSKCVETITGLKASAGYLRIYIYNEETNERVAYTDVYVTVK